MIHLTPKQIEDYHKTREKGLVRYVLFTYVLGYGGLMAAGYIIINLLQGGLPSNWIIMTFTFPIVCALGGLLMWLTDPWRHNVLIEHQKKTGDRPKD